MTSSKKKEAMPNEKKPIDEQTSLQEAEENFFHTTMAEEEEDFDPEYRAQTKEEIEAVEGMMREIRRNSEGTLPPKIRYAGYLVALTVFFSLVTMWGFLGQEVSFATRVYGPSELVPGGRNSFRIALFVPKKNVFVQGFQGWLWLKDTRKHKKILLFQGKTTSDMLLANVQIPHWRQGHHYQLELLVKCQKGEERTVRKIRLAPARQVTPRYSKEKYRLSWNFTPLHNKNLRLQILTEGRAIVASLPNWILLRVMEKDEPPTPQSKKIHPIQPSSQATSYPASQPTSLPTSQPHPLKTHQSSATPPIKITHHPQQSPPDKKLWGHGKKTSSSAKLLDIFSHHKSRKAHPLPSNTPRKNWHPPRAPIKIYVNEHHGPNDNFTPLETLITDRWGFAKFHYIPDFFQINWRFFLKTSRKRYDIPVQLETEGYQIVLDLPKVLLKEGEPFRATVETLNTRGTVHLDIVQWGRRLWSQQFPVVARKSHINIKIPKEIKGLCTIQVYTEFFFPGTAYDARLIYIGQPTKQTLLKALRQHLIFRGDGMNLTPVEQFEKLTVRRGELSQWARYLFATAKARFVMPILLDESSEQRRKALRAAQRAFRNHTLLFVGALGTLVLLTVFIWLMLGYRRDYLLMQKAKEEGIGALETRGMFIMILSLILFAILFAGILYVLWAMRWTYDFI